MNYDIVYHYAKNIEAIILFSQVLAFCIGQRRRNASEMSNPEMALVMEKEHLRNAEESDYMVMENLIQRRYNDDQPESGAGLLSVVSEKREFRLNSWPARTLRRASAIEGDIPTSTGNILCFCWHLTITITIIERTICYVC